MRLVESGGLLADPAFRAWFGNSRAVDASGNPLRLYHGTFSSANHDADDETADDHGIKVFADTNSQGGFWFTARPDYANSFTFNGTGEIYPVYLSVQRPLAVDVDDIENPSEDLLIRAQNAGYDGLHYEGPGDRDGGQWFVFRPNQIKSVFNRGWNAESDHISEARRDR